MPRKLTVLGALAAVVLGAVSLLGDGGTALAGPGGPVQDFDVDASICYGAAGNPEPFLVGAVCPAGTSDVAVAGPQYSLIKLDVGSRLTLPVTYTPNDFPFTSGADGAVVGTVTALTDVFCDAPFRDILAKPPHLGTHADWPNGWTPYDFKHENPPFTGAADAADPAGADDSYLLLTKPTPGGLGGVLGVTPGVVSHEKAILTDLKLDNNGPTINLLLVTGSNSPLSIITEQSTYNLNLRTSVALLAGQPAPPGGFLCLDSPQDSVAANTQGGVPAIDGLYPRFTVFTSAEDVRAGTISRLIDLQCARVGPVVADADGDCIIDGDPGDLAGADGDADGLVDGIEKAIGTNPAVADSDGDGANDFTELAQFTRPIEGGPGFGACPAGPGSANNNADDTDCDGQLDRPDNGADEVTTTLNNINDTSIDDNCPSEFNPAQENSDSPPFNVSFVGTTPYDLSDPTSDTQGDACDTDDDNDSISDVAETGLAIEPVPLAGKSFCEASTGGGDPQNNPSNPLLADSDQDYALDGIECRYLSNPKDATSRYADEAGDNLVNEAFWKTENINIPTGAPGTEENDLDGDGQSGTLDSDSDNDRLTDGAEVKYYQTDPSNDDTDSDGCDDGREASDINSNRAVNVADLSQIAAATGNLRTNPAGAGTVDLTRVNRDVVKATAAAINVTDLSIAAAKFGNCVAQGGITVVQDNDGLAP